MLFSQDYTVTAAATIFYFFITKKTQDIFFEWSLWDSDFYASELGANQKSLAEGSNQRYEKGIIASQGNGSIFKLFLE